ncbi:MAG TPA: hypothetical protein PLQ54_10040, partial [Armatimonadota bacterium]|nr:hypothetical protein [Armatimonadota bacterium]
TCHWCYAALPHAQNVADPRRAVVARPPQEWPLPHECRRCGGPLPPRAFDCPRCGFSMLVDLPAASRPSKRGPWTWLGALVVLGVLAAPVAIVLRPRSESQASPIPQGQWHSPAAADLGFGSNTARPLVPTPADVTTGRDSPFPAPLPSTSIPATAQAYASPAVLKFLGANSQVDWAAELASWICEPPESLIVLPRESPDGAPLELADLGTLRSLAYPDERAVSGGSGTRGHGGSEASYHAHAHTIYVHKPSDVVTAFYQRLLGDNTRQTAWVTERFIPVCQLVRIADREAVVVTVCPGSAFASAEPLAAIRLCRVERRPGAAGEYGENTGKGQPREVGR